MQTDLEGKFGQKVKERGKGAVLALHREVMKAVHGDLDKVPIQVLEQLLFPWGLFLDAHDRAVMLHRYLSPAGARPSPTPLLSLRCQLEACPNAQRIACSARDR